MATEKNLFEERVVLKISFEIMLIEEPQVPQALKAFKLSNIEHYLTLKTFTLKFLK